MPTNLHPALVAVVLDPVRRLDIEISAAALETQAAQAKTLKQRDRLLQQADKIRCSEFDPILRRLP